VSAPGRLLKALSSHLNRHRVVVHFVQDGAGEYVYDDKGAMVGMRRDGCAGREGNFQRENAFVGGVEEFVLVEDFEETAHLTESAGRKAYAGS